MSDEKHDEKHGKTEHLAAWKFKPGECGNRRGRPHMDPVSAGLKRLLGRPIPKEIRKYYAQQGGKNRLVLAEGTTWGGVIELRLLLMAGSGNLKAISEILNRTEGKARVRVDVSTDQTPAIEGDMLLRRLMAMFGDSPELLLQGEVIEPTEEKK